MINCVELFVSVAANIAEGQARQSSAEFAHYLSIARGSLAELDTLLELLTMLEYVRREDIDSIQGKIANVRRPLQKLIQSVRQRVG